MKIGKIGRYELLLPSCRKSAQPLRQAGTSVCWQRGFAEEKKTGREGTTGEELSGDPNRVPTKGEQDKEGKGAMEVSLAWKDSEGALTILPRLVKEEPNRDKEGYIRLLQSVQNEYIL